MDGYRYVESAAECNPNSAHVSDCFNAVKRQFKRIAAYELCVNNARAVVHFIIVRASYNGEAAIVESARKIDRLRIPIAASIFQSVHMSPLDHEATSHGSVAIRTACV